jgi:hypothetical protein
MQVVNEDQEISAVIQVLEEIPLEMLGRVMDDWVDRLRQCIEVGGEYLIELKRNRKQLYVHEICLNRERFWTTRYDQGHWRTIEIHPALQVRDIGKRPGLNMQAGSTSIGFIRDGRNGP